MSEGKQGRKEEISQSGPEECEKTLRLSRKQIITKEDGRYLIFYEFEKAQKEHNGEK